MQDAPKSRDFDRLVSLCHEIGRRYEPGLIFIGGIGVYLHAINSPGVKDLAEATKDADLYISISGFSDLREIEEVSANRRLNKHEFRKDGFSFDVYTERHSDLPVPYAEVAANAHRYDGVRVAAPEHLLTLKLDAAVDRKGSEHGRKDIKDIIRLMLVAGASRFDAKQCAAFMQDRHLELLESIERGPEFLSLARGNAKEAKATRAMFSAVLEPVRRVHGGTAKRKTSPSRHRA